MKRRSFRWLIAIVAVVIIAIAVHFWKEFSSPISAFRRHFGEQVPASVTDISVYGYAALAGSDETLLFKIAPRDLKTLLKQRDFIEVSAQIRSETATVVHPDQWENHEKAAKEFGMIPDRYFEITKFDGLIYYVLITDAESNRVYYHYFKT